MVLVSCVAPLACLGAATPVPEQRLAAGRAAGPLLVTDANGDGDLDILAGSVGVFLGDGSGRFAPAPHSVPAAGESLNDVAEADFDGDGRRDLAFANHEARHVTVLLNAGEGRYEPAPGSPVALHSRPHVHSLAAADWDGDGHTDLVVDSWEDQHVQVLFGDGGGRFLPGPRSEAGNLCCFPRLRAADLDGDGRAELLTVNPPDDRLRVLVSDGHGGFPAARALSFEVPPRPFAFAVGDVNGDSVPDVVLAHYSGDAADTSADGVSALYGRAHGALAFERSPLLAAGPAPVQVALGDVDADGLLDAVAANLAGDSVTVFRGGRTGLAAGGAPLAAVRGPLDLAVADLDGDGRAEIVVAGEDVVLIRDAPLH